MVIGPQIPVGNGPEGVAVGPDGSMVYVGDFDGDAVSVIATATNTVTATIPAAGPYGVAVSPDGSTVYVADGKDNNMWVIAAATNTVTGKITVGNEPAAFGVFIQPPPRFAGTPGFSNCHGRSVAALAWQFGGLNAAAATLGFPNIKALQAAVTAFCHS